MKTVKLNCASCGAPIVVPDDVDTIVCSSCQSTLMVDRGEGYITLKVIEKLAKSIQDIGEMTSSAIKENAFVTQVELKRMQLNQLITMEEMKVNSLQVEIRAVKRRMPGNLTTTPELTDLLLQECDIRMHIRSLYADIAHLEPGWQESLEVIRRDRRLVEQAINYLMPYNVDVHIQNRIVKLHEEMRRIAAAYNALEIKLLRNDLETINFPDFQNLTLAQMEELLQKIPGDLTRLAAGEQTQVKVKLQEQLKTTLNKIKAVYPRRKVESQAGPLPALDIQEPYPESPETLTSMIQVVKTNLKKLSAIPDSQEKVFFVRKLSTLESVLTTRAAADIPAARAKKKKRRTVTTLIVLAVLLFVCLVAFIIIAVTSNNASRTDRKAEDLTQQLIGGVESDADTSQQDSSASTYQPYSETFVEVTASVTYLRERPDTDSTGSYQVEAGEILQVIPDETVPSQWYKVVTLDGSVTGYLAIDWVMPFTVSSVAGDVLTQGFNSTLYSFDYSAYKSDWEEASDDDAYANSKVSYVDGWYELDVTSNDTFIYFYSNITLDDLPDQYSYSITLDPLELEGDIYYGIQTNYIDSANFDALLVSREGDIFLLRIRNGYFNVLYDLDGSTNQWVAVDPYGVNTFSVVRLRASGGSRVLYKYAINGQIIAQIDQLGSGAKGLTMGAMMYFDSQGDHGVLRMDDFVVLQE